MIAIYVRPIYTSDLDTSHDFRTAQEIGSRWNDTVGLCGAGTSPRARPRTE